MSSTTSTSFGPVTSEERLVVVDVLRGFALLGIALVNMSWFAFPNGHEAFEPRLFQETYNKIAGFCVMLFFGGKANSIFSFLFGLGLTIQMQRAKFRENPLRVCICGGSSFCSFWACCTPFFFGMAMCSTIAP